MIDTYFIYKIIGTEWKNLKDEELCGAADTLENAKLVVSALDSIDPAHREIRNESSEVVKAEPFKKYYILKLSFHELGAVCERDTVGIADTLENARRLLNDISRGTAPSKYFEVRDEDWNKVEL